MLRSIGKQSGESVESVLKKKRKGCGRKNLQKRKVLSLKWNSECHEPFALVPCESCGNTVLGLVATVARLLCRVPCQHQHGHASHHLGWMSHNVCRMSRTVSSGVGSLRSDPTPLLTVHFFDTYRLVLVNCILYVISSYYTRLQFAYLSLFINTFMRYIGLQFLNI